MYIRFSALLPIAALVAAVAAAPNALEARGGSGSSQCNSGSLQCCTSTADPTTDSSIVTLLGLLGIVDDLTGLIGLGCSPITVIGTGGGATCSQESVCCTGNTFTGLINLGCSPINLNL